MKRTVGAQIERLIAMKAEFSRAIDEAIDALNVIGERAKSQEWLDWAEEYGFDEDVLLDSAIERLVYAEQDYNEAYDNLHVDDIAFYSLDELF